MHIMEGFLPWQWCLVWWLIALPFLIMGILELRAMMRKDREYLPLLGVCGAFIFILSALKLPSVTGSCSHPTGTGLSTMCFGVFITSIVGAIVLLFQALLLAHGGLSTLGANMVSMAIGGPIAGYGVYRLLKDTKVNIYLTVFLVTAVADLVTYVITSFELALAYPPRSSSHSPIPPRPGGSLLHLKRSLRYSPSPRSRSRSWKGAFSRSSSSILSC